MRTYTYRRRRNHEPAALDPLPQGVLQPDGPRCFFCTANRRRFNQSLCSLGFVLVIGTLAFTLTRFLDDELPFEMDEALNVRKAIDYLQYQIDDLYKAVQSKESLADSKTNMQPHIISKGDQELPDEKIMELIKTELTIYDSDKTGITDYALENLGACILSTKNTVSLDDESSALTIFGFPVWVFHSSPRVILQPSMQPGQCWAFEGRGEVIIKLMTEIMITAISIEHISKELSPYGDISSAPKDFELFMVIDLMEIIQWAVVLQHRLISRGYHETGISNLLYRLKISNEGIKSLDEYKLYSFGCFTYLNEGPTLQMFHVKRPTTDTFGIVEIHFNTNHGNEHYTCVYRVRIHGKLLQNDWR